MMGGSTPSNSLSGHGNKTLEDLDKKYNKIIFLFLSIYKKLISKPPLWENVPNYALKSSGAKVLCNDTSESYGARSWWSVFSRDFRQPVRPQVVIEDNPKMNPGNCWAFAGQQGFLTVALSHQVRVTSVTLGHVTKTISPTGHIQNAPKDFSVYGLESSGSAGVKLGSFTYEENGPMFQNFRIAEKGGAGVSTHEAERAQQLGRPHLHLPLQLQGARTPDVLRRAHADTWTRNTQLRTHNVALAATRRQTEGVCRDVWSMDAC
ncbi:SUN domain-containing protein 5-like [Festucalex cinctus]